jgi:DNA-directed RNA polymerase specialized sigma24 family protein
MQLALAKIRRGEMPEADPAAASAPEVPASEPVDPASKRGYRLTPEQRSAMIRKAWNGGRLTDIAREYGVSIPTVRHHVNKASARL